MLFCFSFCAEHLYSQNVFFGGRCTTHLSTVPSHAIIKAHSEGARDCQRRPLGNSFSTLASQIKTTQAKTAAGPSRRGPFSPLSTPPRERGQHSGNHVRESTELITAPSQAVYIVLEFTARAGMLRTARRRTVVGRQEHRSRGKNRRRAGNPGCSLRIPSAQPKIPPMRAPTSAPQATPRSLCSYSQGVTLRASTPSYSEEGSFRAGGGATPRGLYPKPH